MLSNCGSTCCGVVVLWCLSSWYWVVWLCGTVELSSCGTDCCGVMVLECFQATWYWLLWCCGTVMLSNYCSALLWWCCTDLCGVMLLWCCRAFNLWLDVVWVVLWWWKKGAVKTTPKSPYLALSRVGCVQQLTRTPGYSCNNSIKLSNVFLIGLLNTSFLVNIMKGRKELFIFFH